VLPLLGVGEGELPVLVRVVQPRQEAPPLLLVGDVEEELPDRDPTPVEVGLEVPDRLEPLLPDPLRDERRRRCCRARSSGWTLTTRTSS